MSATTRAAATAAKAKPAAELAPTPNSVIPVLPAELAEVFERPAPESADESISLHHALSELQMFVRSLSDGDKVNAKIRYVTEPFTSDKPQPLRPDRGDFEMSFKMPGFFGSTFETLLNHVKTAHRIYVHVAGLRITVRVHRLPYWTQACNIVAAVANEAEKRSLRFLPYESLAQAADGDEKLCDALRRLEPDFLFTPVDLSATAPKDVPLGAFLVQQFFSPDTASLHHRIIAFWAVTATADAGHTDNSSAQIKVWLVQAAKDATDSIVDVVGETIKIKQEEIATPTLPQSTAPVPISVVTSLINKKRRANEAEMLI